VNRISHHLTLPDSWSPEQALAAFELLNLLRDHLWAAYGPAIQQALRDDQQHGNPRQLPVDFAPDEPF
jgi:hypothetical protein